MTSDDIATRAARSVRDALGAPYSRLLIREEDGSYSAELLEFPGCVASGTSADDAMARLDETMASWIESEIEQGHDIPPPLDTDRFSGELTLRLLPSLHERAALLAQLEGVSLERFLSTAVSHYVGYAAGVHAVRSFFERAGAPIDASPLIDLLESLRRQTAAMPASENAREVARGA